MAHHKRKRPKKRRSGCGLCKPHKQNGAKKEKPSVRRKLTSVKEGLSEESDAEIAFEVAATFKTRDANGDLIERLSEIYFLLKKTGS